MERELLSDDELIGMLDTVTLWVAATPAPRSFWTLRDALHWISAYSQNSELFRPPNHTRSTQYVSPEQIARLTSEQPVHDLASH